MVVKIEIKETNFFLVLLIIKDRQKLNFIILKDKV